MRRARLRTRRSPTPSPGCGPSLRPRGSRPRSTGVRSATARHTCGSTRSPGRRGPTLPAGGFILRTNAEGKSQEEFAADVEFLTRLWAQVQARFEQAAAPAVLHEEGDLIFRVVRDLFSPEVDEFVVDSREVYDKCAGYVEALVPALRDRVRRWA